MKKGHKPDAKLKQRFSRRQVGGALGFGAVGTAALATVAGISTIPLVLIGLPVFLFPGFIIGGHRLLNKEKGDTPPCKCVGLEISVRIQSTTFIY